MRKIIIDTDIGDDIDDALALHLALTSQALEVVGVTTVFKYTKERCILAKALLQEMGREDIPVIAGIDKPFIQKVDCTKLASQFEVIEVMPVKIREGHAIDFILDSLKKDSDLELAAIGPLTNIAAAILKAPEIMRNRKISIMGGMISNAYPEWNIMNDPEAARIVFESGMDIILIGLDVTLKCRLNDEELKQIEESDLDNTKLLKTLIKKWMRKSKHHPILHDPLVIGYLIKPEILSLKEANIIVETQGEFTRGITVDKRDVFGHHKLENANCRVAVDVNREEFLSIFME
ncbi:MAG: nucleoside hydrolase [Anaerocolumna sp.]